MSVCETFDYPGRLEVDEYSIVVGSLIGGQYAGNAHPEGINASEVEDVLGRRGDCVTRFEIPEGRKSGPDYAIAQAGDPTAAGDLQFA